jgi:integrase
VGVRPAQDGSRAALHRPTSIRRGKSAQATHTPKRGKVTAEPGLRGPALAFATPDGNPLHPNTLSLHFNRLVAQASLPHIRFHDLRHTSATLMLATGSTRRLWRSGWGTAPSRSPWTATAT